MKATETGRLRRQAASFSAAGRGLLYTLKHEGHMRFHLCAAVLVLYFSRWYDFSRTEYAVLFVLFGLVMGLECVNTALERLCDRVNREFDPAIGLVKDIAAGAVLAAALAALAVGVCFFWDRAALAAVWTGHREQPLQLVTTCALLAGAALFLFLPGRRDIPKK